jgi:hypothetical protein
VSAPLIATMRPPRGCEQREGELGQQQEVAHRDREGLVDLVQLELEQRLERRGGRVGDDDVEVAVALGEPLEQRPDAVLLEQVELLGAGARRQRLAVGDDRGGLVGALAVGDDHLGAHPASRGFRTQGITFTVYGDDDGRRAHLPDGPAAADHPGRRVGRGPSSRGRPAGHGAQPLPRGPLRRRAGRGPRRGRAALAGAHREGFRREAFGIPSRTRPAAWSPGSTSSATSRAPTGCSRTTCATRPASPTCSRTARR